MQTRRLCAPQAKKISVYSIEQPFPKSPVLRAACALIDATPLDWRDGVNLIKHVGSYDGQRASLGFVYFASDCISPEGFEALSETDALVREK